MENLKCVFEKAESVVLYSGGKQVEIMRGDSDFSRLLDCVLRSFKHAREMPAFGVAIDELTKSFQGRAIEFCFGGCLHHGSMGFERLYLRIEKHYVGVNLERFLGGVYGGRCFYLNLDRDLSALCELCDELFESRCRAAGEEKGGGDESVLQ